jgi:hypothetical protein
MFIYIQIQKLKGQLKQREEYNEALAIKATKRVRTMIKMSILSS